MEGSSKQCTDSVLHKMFLVRRRKKKCFSIRKTNLLVLFREIITLYSENCIKCTNKLCGQNSKVINVEVNSS